MPKYVFNCLCLLHYASAVDGVIGTVEMASEKKIGNLP